MPLGCDGTYSFQYNAIPLISGFTCTDPITGLPVTYAWQYGNAITHTPGIYSFSGTCGPVALCATGYTYDAGCNLCHSNSSLPPGNHGDTCTQHWDSTDCRWETPSFPLTDFRACWRTVAHGTQIPYDDPYCFCCVLCDSGYHWDDATQDCIPPDGGPPPSGGGNGPDTLHLDWGPYLAVYADADVIRFTRSAGLIPPWEIDVAVTAPTGGDEDSQPAISRQQIGGAPGRLEVLFTRSPSASPPLIYRAVSDDDGETWTEETTTAVISNASHPEIFHDPVTGVRVEAGYRSGFIYGVITNPGESPGTEFRFNDSAGAAIPVDDDRFSLSIAPDGSRRWLLLLVDGGDLKTYQSWDEAQTWTEIV